MAKVENVDGVMKALRHAARRYFDSPGAVQGESVIVGYTQRYALKVHEDRDAYHRVGRAGYLLDVAREIAGEIGEIVKQGLLKGLTLGKALLLGGLRLQRESQLNAPVDTGALKGSAFTRQE